MKSRRRWIVALLVALPLMGLGWLLFGGPAPRLASVATEPVLQAPLEAEQTRWEDRESSFGIMPVKIPAWVRVRYTVDEVTAEDALNAWITAYGDRYDFSPIRTRMDGEQVVTGRSEDVTVSISAWNVQGTDGKPGSVVSVYATGL